MIKGEFIIYNIVINKMTKEIHHIQVWEDTDGYVALKGSGYFKKSEFYVISFPRYLSECELI